MLPDFGAFAACCYFVALVFFCGWISGIVVGGQVGKKEGFASGWDACRAQWLAEMQEEEEKLAAELDEQVLADEDLVPDGETTIRQKER